MLLLFFGIQRLLQERGLGRLVRPIQRLLQERGLGGLVRPLTLHCFQTCLGKVFLFPNNEDIEDTYGFPKAV